MGIELREPATATFEILLVDEDPATISLLSDAVRGMAGVRCAPDGYRALYELTAHPVDVVVLELFVPGVNGVELLRRMEATGLHVPVVVLTAGLSPHPELGGLGVRRVLHKPASVEVLRTVLVEVLDPVAAVAPGAGRRLPGAARGLTAA